MKVQITEWQELGIVAEGFDARSILNEENKNAGKGGAKEKTSPGASLPAFLPSSLNPAWRSLPLDTLHFKSLELRLLALFDDLDNQLDGRLIKSENYQALNTLKDKFKGRVKCCYIDPPYNTGSDGFVYNDSFRHSSWISMMQDRISAAVRTAQNAELKIQTEMMFAMAKAKKGKTQTDGTKEWQVSEIYAARTSDANRSMNLFEIEYRGKIPGKFLEVKAGGGSQIYWQTENRMTEGGVLLRRGDKIRIAVIDFAGQGTSRSLMFVTETGVVKF